jgi:hypothetical protein
MIEANYQAALNRIGDRADISWEELAEIFASVGFTYHSPSWGTVVYYHPRYEACGQFVARQWLDCLSPVQAAIVKEMIKAARVCEKIEHIGE